MFFHGFVSAAVAWRSVQHGGGCQPEGKANLLFLSLPSPPFQFRVSRMREMAVCVCCVAPCCLWKRVTRTVCSEKINYIEYPCKIIKYYFNDAYNSRWSIQKRRQGKTHFKTSMPSFPFFNQSPSPSSSFVLTALSLSSPLPNGGKHPFSNL